VHCSKTSSSTATKSGSGGSSDQSPKTPCRGVDRGQSRQPAGSVESAVTGVEEILWRVVDVEQHDVVGRSRGFAGRHEREEVSVDKFAAGVGGQPIGVGQ
jgi:hypothetical protein